MGEGNPLDALNWFGRGYELNTPKSVGREESKAWALSRRCASGDSTNQNALFVECFSRLWRAVFIGVYGALFQACVGNFHAIRSWKVAGTLYLDSSYVTLKYFAFLSVYDKFELLVMYKPPWWFECCFCRSSWIHCWLLLTVLWDFLVVVILQPFFFANFGVYPGLAQIGSPLWSYEPLKVSWN